MLATTFFVVISLALSASAVDTNSAPHAKRLLGLGGVGGGLGGLPLPGCANQQGLINAQALNTVNCGPNFNGGGVPCATQSGAILNLQALDQFNCGGGNGINSFSPLGGGFGGLSLKEDKHGKFDHAAKRSVEESTQ